MTSAPRLAVRLGLVFVVGLAWVGAFAFLGACDSPSDSEAPAAAQSSTAPSTAPAAPAAPPEPVAPEIIVDRSNVSIGSARIPTGEPALADSVGTLLNGKPAIEGRAVDVVAMRNARPSQVAAVVAALRTAKATSIVIKTEARDQTTQKLPLSFPASLPDCTVVAWIAKDSVIDVWRAAGGPAHRVARGLAGPDMTLGTDAVRAQWSGCNAPVMAVGAEDAMTWGLVFDLGTTALGAPGSRASSAVLLTSAVPGKKVAAP